MRRSVVTEQDRIAPDLCQTVRRLVDPQRHPVDPPAGRLTEAPVRGRLHPRTNQHRHQETTMRFPKINWTTLAEAWAPLAPTGVFFSPDGAIYGADGALLSPARTDRPDRPDRNVIQRSR
jgi:hypothetical protein